MAVNSSHVQSGHAVVAFVVDEAGEFRIGVFTFDVLDQFVQHFQVAVDGQDVETRVGDFVVLEDVGAVVQEDLQPSRGDFGADVVQRHKNGGFIQDANRQLYNTKKT